jgi:hypothetical protein
MVAIGEAERLPVQFKRRWTRNGTDGDVLYNGRRSCGRYELAQPPVAWPATTSKTRVLTELQPNNLPAPPAANDQSVTGHQRQKRRPANKDCVTLLLAAVPEQTTATVQCWCSIPWPSQSASFSEVWLPIVWPQIRVLRLNVDDALANYQVLVLKTIHQGKLLWLGPQR